MEILMQILKIVMIVVIFGGITIFSTLFLFFIRICFSVFEKSEKINDELDLPK